MKEEIKVKAKNRKDKFGAFILEKEINKYLNESKDMFNEYQEIINKVMFFRMKWGIPVEIVIKKQVTRIRPL